MTASETLFGPSHFYDFSLKILNNSNFILELKIYTTSQEGGDKNSDKKCHVFFSMAPKISV
jgi:hypothetical protein